MKAAPRIALLVLSMVAGGLAGFFGGVVALHTFWPMVGVVPFLDFVLASILSATSVAALYRRASVWLVTPLIGLAAGAWIVAWHFGGYVSI
ncbi:hypothetical protein [Jannaschia sp. LMIT008]|uniref:hypothetical protein n=1 Tax=Jannaschia maritima TaxID=3032585 RepID=UPI002811C0F9|nr:hypothetical protein [Jannaschia sp. LMIT008]